MKLHEKTWGKLKKPEIAQENLPFSIVIRDELKSELYIITIGNRGQNCVQHKEVEFSGFFRCVCEKVHFQ